jgi:cytidine deaminase
MTDLQLLKAAEEAKNKAYVPYSKFRVGAALLTKEGKVYTGCNIENASFGATNCAERTAIFKAVSEGEKEFAAIAINTDAESLTFPCGICRQVMVEFAHDLKLIIGNPEGKYKVFTMDDILPNSFSPKDLI